MRGRHTSAFGAAAAPRVLQLLLNTSKPRDRPERTTRGYRILRTRAIRRRGTKVLPNHFERHHLEIRSNCIQIDTLILHLTWYLAYA